MSRVVAVPFLESSWGNPSLRSSRRCSCRSSCGHPILAGRPIGHSLQRVDGRIVFLVLLDPWLWCRRSRSWLVGRWCGIRCSVSGLRRASLRTAAWIRAAIGARRELAGRQRRLHALCLQRRRRLFELELLALARGCGVTRRCLHDGDRPGTRAARAVRLPADDARARIAPPRVQLASPFTSSGRRSDAACS